MKGGTPSLYSFLSLSSFPFLSASLWAKPAQTTAKPPTRCLTGVKGSHMAVKGPGVKGSHGAKGSHANTGPMEVKELT